MLLQQTLSLQRPAVMHPAGIGRLPQLRRGSSLHSVTPPHVPKPFLVQPQTSFGCPPRWLQGRDCRAKAADIPAESEKNGPADHLVSVFKVFSDPKCNKKFLALAIGQMLCSVATLMHDSYLPVYVQDELGLSNTKIGAVQGLAQFLCQLTKGVSGVVGDVLGSQVRVLVFGTFLTLACKPMFALLSSVYGVFGVTATIYWFFCAKLLDRMSKGIREAPTKAVMNELAKESGDSPDAAYGLRQSLATAGALMGTAIAPIVFIATGSSYVLTFTAAIIPPAIALLWLLTQFKEELVSGGAGRKQQSAASDGPKLSLTQKAKALVGAFKPAYWQALIVVAALYFARFDASFVSLRAKQVMPKSYIPLVFFVSSLIQTFVTAPLAKLSGTGVGFRNKLLGAGFIIMIMANGVFGLDYFASTWGMFVGAALLGMHMAMTHSITVSMIASYMPTGEVAGIGKLSGTAVSFTDFLLGFVLAASNLLAGELSDRTRLLGLGNVGCFGGGAVACSLALLLLIAFSKFGDLGKDEEVVTKARKKQG
eukprot:jgi/Chrzof1/4201/Cz14g02210.t1